MTCQQFPVNAEMLCRSGFRPTLLSGESPTYDSVSRNSRISVSVHRELLVTHVWVFLLLLTVVSGSYAWADGFSGYAETKGVIHMEHTRDPLAEGWVTVMAKYEKKLGGVQCTAGVRGEAVTSDEERGKFSFDPADRDIRRSTLSIQDFWVRIPINPALDLQAGHFLLGWGKTDGYSPADAFLPRDLTDPFADEKIPLWAVRLSGQTGNVRFEVVDVPITTPWRLPVLGSRYAPFSQTGLPDNTDYLERENDLPDDGFAAIRILATIDEWDIGIWGRTGVRPAPLLIFRSDQAAYSSDGHLVMPIERRYAREKAAGVELSRTVASWVVRGEAATLSSDDPELGNAVIGVLSAEKGFGDGTLLITYGQNFNTTPVDPSLLFDRAILPALIAAWHKTEEWGEWKLVVTESLKKAGGLFTGETCYNLTDYWRLTVGMDLPYGERDSYYGGLYAAKRARLALRRSW